MFRLLQDVRFAVRSFAKAPGFTAIAMVVLALGIGANSATFTIVNAMLFQPVAGHDDGTVGLFRYDRTKADSYRAFAYPNYVDIREQNDVFASLAAHTFSMAGVPAGDASRRIFVELVTANYFETLQVPMAAGRGFRLEEEQPGANIPVVVVPFERWRASGFNPAYVGSTLKINAVDFTIVGVAAKGFAGTMAFVGPELWVPLGMFDTVVTDIFNNQGKGLGDRQAANVIAIGRLREGISTAAASARLETLSRQLEAAAPGENQNLALSINPLPRMSTSTEPQTDTKLGVAGGVLMALAGTVLLIACLNLANMLMARGSTRRKEIAIRLALGGARRRIVRQLVTESLLLALSGAAAGLLFAFWATRLLASTLSAVLPMTLAFKPTPDLNVMLATTAFAVVATLLSGVGPALKLSGVDLLTDLKENAADPGGTRRRFSGRNILVVAQIALSLALLSAGGLFARSAFKAAAATPGYGYDRSIVGTIDTSVARYDEPRSRTAYRNVLDRLRAVPGIDAASFGSTIPFGDFHEGRGVERLGRKSPDTGTSTYRIIGADYFRSLGLQMQQGREFTASEEGSAEAPRVAVIDERLAQDLFPGENPVGEMIRFVKRDGDPRTAAQEPMQIVGVAPSIREELFDREAVSHIYVPSGRNFRSTMNLHVRTASTDRAAVEAMIGTIRQELRAVDDRLPVLELTTMQRFHDKSLVLWAARMGGQMLTAFGVIALALAVAGVYGLKSYLVSRRTREIGIRIALGADRQRVLGMVMRDAAWLTAAGLAIGLPIALLLGRAMSGLLFGIRGYDPLVFVSAPLALGTASMIASYLPARRATRVNPLTALRSE
jgi:predicted permease